MAFATTIRPATPDDLGALAQVRATAWREAYTGLLPEAVIAAQWERIPRAIELWQRALDAGETVWLGLLDGEIVGYAHASVDSSPQAPVPLELVGLYLLRRAQGLGLGKALVRTAVGDAACHLWVVESNEQAIGFYRSVGFELDGARQEVAPVFEGVLQARMVRH